MGGRRLSTFVSTWCLLAWTQHRHRNAAFNDCHFRATNHFPVAQTTQASSSRRRSPSCFAIRIESIVNAATARIDADEACDMVEPRNDNSGGGGFGVDEKSEMIDKISGSPPKSDREGSSSKNTGGASARKPPTAAEDGGTAADDPMDAALDFCHLVGALKTTPRTGWVRRGVPKYESVADHSWRVALLALALLPPSSSSSYDEEYEEPTDRSQTVGDDGFDVNRCVAMGLVHDVAEALVGDICPDDKIPKEEKMRREHEAMQTITSMLQKSQAAIIPPLASGKDYDSPHHHHHHHGTINDGNGSKDSDSGGKVGHQVVGSIVPRISLRSSWERLLDLFHEYERRNTKEAIAVKDLDLLDMILQADEYERNFDMDLHEFFDGTPPSRFRTPTLRRIAERIHRRRSDRLILVRKQQEQQQNQKQKQQQKQQRRQEEGATLSSSSSSSLQRHLGGAEGSDNTPPASLSIHDLQFVENYSKSSRLSSQDVETMLKALRAFEKKTPTPTADCEVGGVSSSQPT